MPAKPLLWAVGPKEKDLYIILGAARGIWPTVSISCLPDPGLHDRLCQQSSVRVCRQGVGSQPFGVAQLRGGNADP